MNVLFVDIDGVLNSFSTNELIVDRMIKVLKIICDKYNCKVVIESTHKPKKYEDEEESKIIKCLYEKAEKYNIEVLGFTPGVEIYEKAHAIKAWKEFEIIYYLRRHPKIKHFAVIDDNDFIDLFLLKDYLVETKYYVENNPDEEGLTEKHIKEVEKVLKRENIFK